MKRTLTHLGVKVALLGIAVAAPTAVVGLDHGAPAGDPAGLAKSFSPPLEPCAWSAESGLCWAGPGGTPIPPPSTVGPNDLPYRPTSFPGLIPGAP